MKTSLRPFSAWSRTMLVGSILLLGFVSLRAQDPTEAVLAADRARAAAMVAGDLSVLDALLADDLRYTHSSGRLETKAAHLGTFREGLRYEYFRTSNLHIHPVTPDVVVVSGVIDQRKGQPGKMNDRHLLFQAVWRREKMTWRLVSLQTADPAAAGK